MKVETFELREMVARVLGVGESAVTESAEVGNPPEWDSLGHLRICLAVEERFGVGLGLEEIAEATSIEKLKSVLETRSLSGTEGRI